jgi:hypothetical protein
MKKTWIAAAVCMGGLSVVSAQTITGLVLDRAQAQVGQTVTATVRLEPGDNINCGLQFYWGDGTIQDIKVLDASQIPLVLKHTYTKPGNFALMAEGKKVTSHLKCLGANARASLTVTLPAPAAVAPKTSGSAAVAPMVAAPAVASPKCPAGWSLSAKSVSKKTGAYTCTAKPGTALPSQKLACTGDTGYFENAKKGQLGCKL